MLTEECKQHTFFRAHERSTSSGIPEQEYFLSETIIPLDESKVEEQKRTSGTSMMSSRARWDTETACCPERANTVNIDPSLAQDLVPFAAASTASIPKHLMA